MDNIETILDKSKENLRNIILDHVYEVNYYLDEDEEQYFIFLQTQNIKSLLTKHLF
jgi:hypothetical protein